MFEDMTVDAVKEVLEELSDSDQAQILHWLDERHNAKWDRQMERDFAPGGPAQSLFDELNRERAGLLEQQVNLLLAQLPDKVAATKKV